MAAWMHPAARRASCLSDGDISTGIVWSRAHLAAANSVHTIARMWGRRSDLLVAALVAAAACAPRELDPVGMPTTGGTPNGPNLGTAAGGSLAASIAARAGPNTRMIVGSNAGALIDDHAGSLAVFEQKPGALVEAAAASAMPVCSVEPQRLVTASQAAGPEAITVEDAMIDCGRFDFGYVFDQLAASQLPSSRVVIGTNAGIRMGGTDRGFGYYYDEDVVRLLRAARKLYIRACVVVPKALAIPLFPEGQTSGVTIEEALAGCGASP